MEWLALCVGRLAGLSLVASHINYYWPGFPSNLAAEGFKRLPVADQWTFRIAHYAPWLFNWWMTQKWFPTLSFTNSSTDIFSPGDLEVLKKLADSQSAGEVIDCFYYHSTVIVNKEKGHDIFRLQTQSLGTQTRYDTSLMMIYQIRWWLFNVLIGGYMFLKSLITQKRGEIWKKKLVKIKLLSSLS